MKKLLFIATIMSAALFSSCASDGDTPDPEPETADESWTVMYYSVGGGNLDSAQVNNMAEAFLSTEYTTINMTFQFKFSKELSEKPWDGVGRFDLSEQRENIGTIKMTEEGVMDFIKDIKPTIIGDASYDMSSAKSLTEFIKWSMDKHPATHYMLVLSDHGSGYDILADNNITPKEPEETDEARHYAILGDDNLDSRQLSLINTVKGIEDAMGGSKLDVIYTDACLMCTAENLCGYKQVANYYIGSQELTPGAGGEYTQLLNIIGKNSTDAWEMAKSYINYLVSSNHWKKEKDDHADAGVYNLQSASFDAALADIASFAEMLGDDLSSTTGAGNVNDCVMKAQVAQDVTSSEITINWGEEEYTIKDIQDLYTQDPTSFIQTIKEWSEDTRNALSDAVDEAGYGITMADFMRKMADYDDAYQDIHDEYISNLKNCTYIANTFGKDAWEYTSMSVNVFGMTDAALGANTASMWVKNGKICNNWSKYGQGSLNAYTASQLKSLYSNTAFETKTGWAKNFLSKLTVNPGIFFNPSSETNTK